MSFLDLVNKRYSVRSYEERGIEKEKMDYIMECVRLAPSAVNFQPWKFYVVTDKEKLNDIKSTYKREWIQSVPCIIVACTNHDESWHRRSDDKDHADIDLAIAIEHLCLAAAEQGLGTCWVCNFDAVLCRQLMSLPDNMEPVALIPIGYTQNTEISEKKRKDIGEICTYI